MINPLAIRQPIRQVAESFPSKRLSQGVDLRRSTLQSLDPLWLSKIA